MDSGRSPRIPKSSISSITVFETLVRWRKSSFDRCKVFHPLAYYAAFFSIRATSFSYELMCQGKEKLNHFLADYERRKDSLTKKEQDTVKDMKIVQEMYARGFPNHPLAQLPSLKP